MEKMIMLTMTTICLCGQILSQTPNLQAVTGAGASTTNPVTFIHNTGSFAVNVTNNSDADFAIGITAPGATNKYASLQSTIANRNMILNGFNGGYVGIGTASPTQKLEVNGNIKFSSEYNQLQFPASLNVSGGITGDDGNYKRLTLYHGNSIAFETGSNALSSGNTRLFISGTGNVGIGTGVTAPKGLLQLNSSLPELYMTTPDPAATGAAAVIRGNNGTWLFGYGGASGAEVISIGSQDGTASDRSITFAAGGTAKARILANGNMLIGKTTQINTAYKLDVNGITRTTKLVVNSTGADFVFEKGYQLPSLDSVEAFVKVNRHLPGIAPAAEMQKEGLEVGEQQTKLLQKIEELTLYLIEQNKKIDQQQFRLQQQENLMKEQATQIQQLLRAKKGN